MIAGILIVGFFALSIAGLYVLGCRLPDDLERTGGIISAESWLMDAGDGCRCAGVFRVMTAPRPIDFEISIRFDAEELIAALRCARDAAAAIADIEVGR